MKRNRKLRLATKAIDEPSPLDAVRKENMRLLLKLRTQACSYLPSLNSKLPAVSYQAISTMLLGAESSTPQSVPAARQPACRSHH